MVTAVGGKKMPGEQAKGSRPTRVVIAESNVSVCRALSDLLSTDPHIQIVGEAHTGHEAIAMAEEFTPDVVLMDCEMSEMGGLTATREIKRRHLVPRIVVLTMDQSLEPEARRSGADGFLVKGCTPETLLNAVRSGPFIPQSTDRPDSSQAEN
jgi:DNA-binding NarL/FixJ family response regulator